MIELAATEFGKASALLESLAFHLAIQGILEGTVPARVFVDDSIHPNAVLVRARHRFYLAGSPNHDAFNQDIRYYFEDAVVPQARASGDAMFMLCFAPEAWEGQIDLILKDRLPLKGLHQYYVRDVSALMDWRTILPEEFEVRMVDARLLEERSLGHLDALMDEMCSERPSVQDFLAKSFGICAIHGEELAGWCLSEYNTTDRCEVGIETLERFRRRGLATCMTAALVEHARSKGINRIGWNCWASNIPSAATARKAGFRLEHDYPVYYAWFNAADNLAVHGNVCFEQQQYEQALDWYVQAFAEGNAKGWAYWSAACAAALLERHAVAMQYLAMSIDKGNRDIERIVRCEYLKSLHAMTEWQALIKSLRKPELSSFFQESPLVGLDLDLRRDTDGPRP